MNKLFITSFLLSATLMVSAQTSSCPDSNHPHWIDLGLPSGTLWRCCNIDAKKPEYYGGYYYFDQATSIAPTLEQIKELLENTTSVWATTGRKFTGANGHSIFLPAAGAIYYPRNSQGQGKYGYYWSSTSSTKGGPADAYELSFDSNGASWHNVINRNTRKMPVRPVKKGKSDAVTLTARSYTRQYGEENPSFGYTVTNGSISSGTPTITCSATKASPVGTYPIVISKGSVSNSDVKLVNGTLTITQAPLNASVGNYTRQEGEDNPTFKLSYSGWKNGDTESVLTKKPTATTTATKNSPAGTYLITISGGEAKNYKLSYMNGTLTVTPKSVITITAKSYSRAYGDANPTFDYTVSGGSLTGTPKLTCTATKSSDVGTYTIKVEKGTVQGEVKLVDGTLTVTQAPLTVSVGNYTRQVGEENPTFKPSYSGWKNGDTESVLTKKPTATTTATKNSPAGTYLITVSGGKAKNYKLTYMNGTLTVTPKSVITITAKSYSRAYGDANPTFDYTVSGGSLTGTPKLTCTATKISDVGTYTIKVEKGTVQGEVKLVDGTLTVTQAPLTVSVGNYTRQVGEENPTFKPSYSGWKNGDTESVLTKKPTATTTATKNSPAGTYLITVSGGEAKNYKLSYMNGTLTVTPKSVITITAKSYSRAYGDANPTFDYTVSGGTLTGTPKLTCTATKSSDVGTYTIKVEKGTVQGEVKLVDGTLTVTQAPLTVSVGNYTRQVGEENPTFKPSYSGWKNGDTESVLTKKPTATTTATKNSPAGTYLITVSGGEAKNYKLSYKNGTLTVTPKSPDKKIIITANDVTIAKGGTADLMVKMNYYTSEVVVAYGFTLNLPTGVDLYEEDGEYDFTVNKDIAGLKQSRADDGLHISKNNSGGYLVSYYTLSLTPLTSTHGELFRIKLKATSDVNGMGYIKDISLSNYASQSLDQGNILDVSFNVKSSGTTVKSQQTISLTEIPNQPYGNTYILPTKTDQGQILTWKVKDATIASISGSTLKTQNVGTTTVTATQSGNDSYASFSKDYLLTVNQTPLTVSVGDYTRKEGEDNPTFKLSYSGWKNGDTERVLTMKPTTSCSARKSSPAGTYPITVSGGSAKNYNLSYVNGTLTVTSKPIEEEYYYVGMLNSWDIFDKSYPFTKQSDGKTWKLTMSCKEKMVTWNDNADEFKIGTAASLIGGWDNDVYGAPEYNPTALNGTMTRISGPNFQVPFIEGMYSYTVSIIPSTMHYEIVVNKNTPTPTSRTVTLSSAGYATFYDSQSAYTLPNGLAAQVVTCVKDEKLVYKTIADGSVAGVVPKGTAVMLKSDSRHSGNYTLTSTNSSVTYSGTNLLHGSDNATTTTGDGYHYKLTFGNAGSSLSDVFGWYWGASNGGSFRMDGHKAWLVLPKNGTRAERFTVEGDATSIDDLQIDDLQFDNSVYDLQGRRVSQPSRKGMYIQNGKKVIRK